MKTYSSDPEVDAIVRDCLTCAPLHTIYGTHRPLLMAAALMTKGPVIELGMGNYSTPYLAALCKRQGRPYFGYENNPEWFSKFTHLSGPGVTLKCVQDWELEVPVVPCGLLFLDHAPGERRREDLVRWGGGIADVVVMHDSDVSDAYGYNKAAHLYRWKENSDALWPGTSVWSDTIDVTYVKGLTL